MHGKALINEALKGNPVERTPWVPYTGSQIANLKGYTAQEMFRDADKLYECCIEAESQYSPDGMTPMFDLQVEAAAPVYTSGAISSSDDPRVNVQLGLDF